MKSIFKKKIINLFIIYICIINFINEKKIKVQSSNVVDTDINSSSNLILNYNININNNNNNNNNLNKLFKNNNKNKKLIIGYSLSDDLNYYNNSNYNGFNDFNNKDKYAGSIIWESIDILLIPRDLKNLKEIIKIAHSNQVLVSLMVSYNEIQGYKSIEVMETSIDVIINQIKEVEADGASLYFKFPVDINYKLKIFKFSQALKRNIVSSHFSVSLPLKIGNYDVKSISTNCDFIMVNAYDLDSSFDLARPNSDGVVVRNEIYKYWITQKLIDPNKLILSIPWYGYQFKCNNNNNNNNNEPYNIFLSSCKIDLNSKRKVYYKDIIQYKNGLGSGYKTSMELWNINSRTPYLNYQLDQNGDIYQIQYDNAKSTYYKLAETGLLGCAIWRIDSIYGIPNVEVRNLYNSIDRSLFGNTFNKDYQLY
ncbi:hypothetical protein DDB_G0287463 [Dictyostelium discoideum AX4]|uniref:GH18 domain-containing protein n=1 Tax=Dictyostelium discoideum TaxID=44689 RepID=Q54KC1_DICDI|nr:hypothetical protein DDB_G0287463 [Dictyostelium discoideum AX4]EAL63697.1 hypothetical protein DDB_G0287463 [Dictyostelium discoideum AX4]|eukprot:XP_637200.1 hypothetical protein DDB_G0287463 [Dictyostelium discoideum AX4]